MFTRRLLRSSFPKSSQFNVSSFSTKKKRFIEGQNLNELHRKPVHMVNYSGSRVMELSRVDSGNLLTTSTLESIRYRLDTIDYIESIQNVIISSMSPELFSAGSVLGKIYDEEEAWDHVNLMHDVLGTFSSMHQTTIAIYSGKVDGTAYGMFAGADFCVGTENTRFQVTELLEGHLPLGGCIAYFLAKSADDGHALARYLGISGRVLDAHDLYELGMVSHIVSKNVPADSLCIALAHSVPDSDKDKTVQGDQLYEGGIEEILDSMNLYMEEGDFLGANNEHVPDSEIDPSFKKADPHRPFRAKALADLEKKAKNPKVELKLNKKLQKSVRAEHLDHLYSTAQKEAWDVVRHQNFADGNMTLLQHPVWSRASIVPPQPLDMERYNASEGAEPDSASRGLLADLDEILEAFDADTMAECYERVAALAANDKNSWAVQALQSWDTIDPQLVEAWFLLTERAAATEELEDFMVVEKHCVNVELAEFMVQSYRELEEGEEGEEGEGEGGEEEHDDSALGEAGENEVAEEEGEEMVGSDADTSDVDSSDVDSSDVDSSDDDSSDDDSDDDSSDEEEEEEDKAEEKKN